MCLKTRAVSRKVRLDLSPYDGTHAGERRPIFGRGVVFLAALALAVGAASLAQTPTTTEVDPLSTKEQMIRDRFERFEDRVFKLREQLALEEPETAARLERVLQRAGELGLAGQLDDVIELLRTDAPLTVVIDAQKEWTQQAGGLLDILLARDNRSDQENTRRDLLQDYQQTVSEFLDRQNRLRQASQRLAYAQQLAQQLDAAAQLTNAFIDRQKAITAGPSVDSAPTLQADLAAETRQLADSLLRAAQQDPESSSGALDLDSTKAQTADAADLLSESAVNMAEAARALRDTPTQPVAPLQNVAEQELNRAYVLLQTAQQELREVLSGANEAERQHAVADETRSLADRMQHDQVSGNLRSTVGESGSSARRELDQAHEAMTKAADSLEQDQPGAAAAEQADALEHLKQTQRDLDEALERDRQEDRAKMMQDLTRRFQEMLAEQQDINQASAAFQMRTPQHLPRSEQLHLANLSTRQRSLSEQADQCHNTLHREDATVVLPYLAGQLAEDMRNLAGRLAKFDVGPLTQTIQKEVVETLQQLLDSTAQMAESGESAEESTGRDADEPPDKSLMPSSSELKLLRSIQLRIIARMATIEAAAEDHPQGSRSPNPALESIATRQTECARLAQELCDRVRQTASGEDEE